MQLFNDSDFETPFDRARHFDHGVEYWLAREIMPLFEYTKWSNFKQVIAKAKTACKKSGNRPDSNFADVGKIVDLGAGLQKTIPDFKLTRLACYLIAMNGDPAKQVIADAQTYFAVQTRRQELFRQDKKQLKHQQDVTQYQIAGRSQDWSEKRVVSKESHAQLTNTLAATHEEHKPDYGRVLGEQNKALFDRASREIAVCLGIRPSESVRDHLGKFALQAIDIANHASVRHMEELRRELTTEEQIDIVCEAARHVGTLVKELALLDGTDYLSGAPLDSDGTPILLRQRRLGAGNA
jgi:DNA-damage-inducible protein D